MKLAIETNNIVKRYGNVRAVDGLSLRVKEGEIYGFLGLNGAGKTTTIRMLLGMVKPTSGSCTVLQTRVLPGRQVPWAHVGYLVETPHAYPELTVYDNLEAARRLHPGTSPQAVHKVIERLGISAYAGRKAGTLSSGNMQRLALAKALLHEPRLLILDEPANGLDPAGIVEIRKLLLELTSQEGVTVFMSSHILAEVARTAQRIGIIHRGRLLQEMEIEELEQNRHRRLVLQTRNLEKAGAALISAGISIGGKSNGIIKLTDKMAVEQPDEIANILVHAGTPPTRLVVEEEDLEQYFLRLIGME